jgi:hypothetical protein
VNRCPYGRLQRDHHRHERRPCSSRLLVAAAVPLSDRLVAVVAAERYACGILKRTGASYTGLSTKTTYYELCGVICRGRSSDVTGCFVSEHHTGSDNIRTTLHGLLRRPGFRLASAESGGAQCSSGAMQGSFIRSTPQPSAASIGLLKSCFSISDGGDREVGAARRTLCSHVSAPASGAQLGLSIRTCLQCK